MHVEPLELPIEAEQAAGALYGRPYFAWLDSQCPESPEGRFSYLASDPVETIRVPFGEPEPLRNLAHIGGVSGTPATARHVPRWIGTLAYDAAWSGPRRGRRHVRPGSTAVAEFARYDAVAVFDGATGERWLAADDANAASRLRTRLEQGASTARTPVADIGVPKASSAEDHVTAIRRAKEAIAAGEVYQVNLARHFDATYAGDAFALWLRMRRASPVPLGFYQEAAGHVVLACTMERFLSWDRTTGILYTRPIKGTESTELVNGAARLSANPKERAEHAMIVDLMRNDLGRLAAPGTVRVDRVMEVEPYVGLYHLVSTVSCTPEEGVSIHDVLGATFPPGSVTGAPKERAVELIEALESAPRGIYTGCVGFVSRGGDLSLAVAIRTAVVRDGRARYYAGGGIVSASDPDREVAETELKARVFLAAADSLRSRP